TAIPGSTPGPATSSGRPTWMLPRSHPPQATVIALAATGPARTTGPGGTTGPATITVPARSTALTAILRPAPITRLARAIRPVLPPPAGITVRRWPSGSAPGRYPSHTPTVCRTARTARTAIRLAHRVPLPNLIPEHCTAGPDSLPPAAGWPLPEPARGQ